MIRVLFVCIHNSARSQMAEAYLRKLGGTGFSAESAGIEPGTLNPYVVRVLLEDGIDIAGKKTQAVRELLEAGSKFDYVVTVCSKEAQDSCPVFPGQHVRLLWPFPDPSAMGGSDEEIMASLREVRDGIKAKVLEFVAALSRES